MSKAESKSDTFSTSTGEITISRPPVLSAFDAEEACRWLDQMKRKLERSVDSKTTEKARPFNGRVIPVDDEDEPKPQTVSRPRTGP